MYNVLQYEDMSTKNHNRWLQQPDLTNEPERCNRTKEDIDDSYCTNERFNRIMAGPV